MTDVPSETLSGPTRLRCPLPAGCTAGEAPAALVAMRPSGASAVSVLASATCVAADVDLFED